MKTEMENKRETDWRGSGLEKNETDWGKEIENE
jgi:hypothetical protein